MQDIIDREIKIKGCIAIRKNPTSSCLVFNGNKAVKLLGWLYLDSELYIPRKYSKYQEYLDWRSSYKIPRRLYNENGDLMTKDQKRLRTNRRQNLSRKLQRSKNSKQNLDPENCQPPPTPLIHLRSSSLPQSAPY